MMCAHIDYFKKGTGKYIRHRLRYFVKDITAGANGSKLLSNGGEPRDKPRAGSAAYGESSCWVSFSRKARKRLRSCW